MTTDPGAPLGKPEVGAPEPADDSATLRFQHSPQGAGCSRFGPIRPGGRLAVEYDRARLQTDELETNWEIVCHLRFLPNEQRHSASLFSLSDTEPLVHDTPRSPRVEVLVPPDAEQVELWFESRTPSRSLGWDSQDGQNYLFGAADEGQPVPEHLVVARSKAVKDSERISVVADAASKEPVVTGASGKRLRTELAIRALVPSSRKAPEVWADVHVFDAVGEVIHSGTVPLSRQGSSDEGVLFEWQDEIYGGSGGGSGMGVWFRPDAQLVQYRLYAAVGDRLFTDGVLHQFEVPADEVVRRKPI